MNPKLFCEQGYLITTAANTNLDCSTISCGTRWKPCSVSQGLRIKTFPHQLTEFSTVGSTYLLTKKLSSFRPATLKTRRTFWWVSIKKIDPFHNISTSSSDRIHIFFLLTATHRKNHWKSFANPTQNTRRRPNCPMNDRIPWSTQLKLKQHQIACGSYENVSRRWYIEQFIEFLTFQNFGNINWRTVMGNRWPITNFASRRNRQTRSELLIVNCKYGHQRSLVTDVAMG